MPQIPSQPTEVVAPLEASDDLDTFFDEDGRIAGSPANDEDGAA